MSSEQPTERAQFTDVTRGGEPFTVHFNPTSLQITLSNTLEEKGEGRSRKQYVTKSSAKLSMDLVFDTTDRGADVRGESGRIAQLMQPAGTGGEERTPPVVLFEWGAFAFQGMVEAYTETIDFFSHDGVPLRASVKLVLSQQDVVFSPDAAEGGAPSNAVDVPAGSDVSSAVARAGNPRAARAAAAANGLGSLRLPGGAFTLDAGIELGGAVAFASGGAGLAVGGGIRVGAGIGVGGGIGVGAGIGVGGAMGVEGGIGFGGGVGVGGGFAAGASAGGPAFGGSASRGVRASAGAFAGLRAGAMAPAGPPLDPRRLLPRIESRGVATDGSSTFRVGGQANLSGSASLRTDVGAGARARISFDGG